MCIEFTVPILFVPLSLFIEKAHTDSLFNVMLELGTSRGKNEKVETYFDSIYEKYTATAWIRVKWNTQSPKEM